MFEDGNWWLPHSHERIVAAADFISAESLFSETRTHVTLAVKVNDACCLMPGAQSCQIVKRQSSLRLNLFQGLTKNMLEGVDGLTVGTYPSRSRTSQ